MQHLYMPDGSVNLELIKGKIITYGCGNDGKNLFLKLKNMNVTVDYFCDLNSNLWGV